MKGQAKKGLIYMFYKHQYFLPIIDKFAFRDVWYDIEHSLQPTDVINHYSGWPITR